jgi:hypothetical protein
VEKWKASTEKIRGLLASALGFRDHDFLKLRLYALHEAVARPTSSFAIAVLSQSGNTFERQAPTFGKQI